LSHLDKLNIELDTTLDEIAEPPGVAGKRRKNKRRYSSEAAWALPSTGERGRQAPIGDSLSGD
jgi:hypothetical protein